MSFFICFLLIADKHTGDGSRIPAASSGGLGKRADLHLSRAFAFVVKLAVLELLESFPDQLLKLLRLPGVSLHLL
jgi:hypothetical protein